MCALVLDNWQLEYVHYPDNKVLVAGRQTGKSEAAAYDNGEFAANHPGTNALIISKTERQAEELIIKTLQYLQEFYPNKIGKGKYKPLKSTIWVVHGKQKPSRIMCLPTGLAGEGIRGYTIHKLTIDEAQLPPDAVFNAVTPMLLTTGGKISLIGTPQGKRGFFWEAFENKLNHYKVFHINSETVANTRPLSDVWTEFRKQEMLKFLLREKARMPAKWYAQEYLGEFVEDLDQVFSDEDIAKTAVLKRRERITEGRRYFMGVDVGRTIDPCTFEIFDGTSEVAEQVENIVRLDYPITKTADEIISLDANYKFQGNSIGIDGGGMGAGVVDILLKHDKLKRKIKDLNNSSREVEYGLQGKRKVLLKEDMYRNAIAMIKTGKVKFLDDEDLKISFKSCQMEYKENSKEVLIFGNDTHIVEGCIRALWMIRTKALKLWAA